MTNDNINLAKAPSLSIQVLANGEREEVKLPFLVPTAVIKGIAPLKNRLQMWAILVFCVGGIASVIFLSSLIFGAAPEGSLGYNLSIGVFFLVLLVSVGAFAILGQDYDEKLKSDRFQRQSEYSRSTLGPWLEQNAGMTEGDAYFAAHDMLDDGNRRSVEESNNAWGAFEIEFSATGFRKRNQTVHIWRWVSTKA